MLGRRPRKEQGAGSRAGRTFLAGNPPRPHKLVSQWGQWCGIFERYVNTEVLIQLR